MTSQLIQDMEEIRRRIRFACEGNPYQVSEGAKLFMQGLSEYIGEWQSEIMRMERENARLRALMNAQDEYAHGGYVRIADVKTEFMGDGD